MARKRSFPLFIGTYTARGSEGVYAASFDARTGALEAGPASGGPANPSFLAIHPRRPWVFAVSETGEHAGQAGTGGVCALAYDRKRGAFASLGGQPTGGTAPCHVVLDAKQGRLIVSNYGGGSVAAFRLEADGRIAPRSCFVRHEGRGLNPRRQDMPHAHSAAVSPDGGHVFVADLGLDKLKAYRYRPKACLLEPCPRLDAVLPGGAGPRQIAFHPAGTRAYVINELDATMAVFRYDAASGRLKRSQTVSTLPEDCQDKPSCAHLQVSSDGRFLYGTNRNHDSVVVYAIAPATGRLSTLQHVFSGGAHPRHFALDPTERWLLCANQESDNVVSFPRDPETGLLGEPASMTSLSMPVCLAFSRW